MIFFYSEFSQILSTSKICFWKAGGGWHISISPCPHLFLLATFESRLCPVATMTVGEDHAECTCTSLGSALGLVSTRQTQERLFLVRALGAFTSGRKQVPRNTGLCQRQLYSIRIKQNLNHPQCL